MASHRLRWGLRRGELIGRSSHTATATAIATRKDTGEGLLWVRDSGLLRRGASPWIELLTVLKGLGSLLVKAGFLGEYVDDSVDAITNRTTSVDSLILIAEVANGRYFVHVAFKLDHSGRRTVLYDEIDCCQCLQDSAPLGANGLKLSVQESADPFNVSDIVRCVSDLE